MSKVGFIGLGDMGLAMASNLVRAGHEVVGFDLRDSRRRALEEAGGRAAATIAQAAAHAQAVFVMVMTGEQVEQVMLGTDGLLSSMDAGSTVIVTASVSDSLMRSLAGKLADAGLGLIDAPVSGGHFGAEAGTLAVMAACPEAVLKVNLPLLEAIGSSITHVGETPGQGQATKAALQALIGSSFSALCEAFVLGRKAGIDRDKLAEVFNASVVSSPLLRNATRMILERRFTNAGAHVSTVYKDLGISMDIARRNGVAMFTAAAAYEVMQATIAMFPEGDIWAATQFFERIAGIEA